MASFSDGHTYAFQGRLYYKLSGGRVIEELTISDGLRGVPDHLDAAVYVKGSYNTLSYRCGTSSEVRYCLYQYWIPVNRLYLFKGSQLWYIIGRVFYGPFDINYAFPGVPNNLDAAFFGSDSKIYFVKGDQYWRVSSVWQWYVCRFRVS